MLRKGRVRWVKKKNGKNNFAGVVVLSQTNLGPAVLLTEFNDYILRMDLKISELEKVIDKKDSIIKILIEDLKDV